jgi:hypothetical protein
MQLEASKFKYNISRYLILHNKHYQYFPCYGKVVMSAFSKVEMSAFP